MTDHRLTKKDPFPKESSFRRVYKLSLNILSASKAFTDRLSFQVETFKLKASGRLHILTEFRESRKSSTYDQLILTNRDSE